MAKVPETRTAVVAEKKGKRYRFKIEPTPHTWGYNDLKKYDKIGTALPIENPSADVR